MAHFISPLFLTLLICLGGTHPANADNPIQQALRMAQSGNAQTLPPPSSLELAFSPEGGATTLVIKAISAAKQTIRVAAYAFTSHPIADALINAHKSGIDVKIVIDHDQIRERNHSAAPLLIAAGIPLRVDVVHALLHDKYMIIDSKSVETGSFNFTNGAEQFNAENILVLWDDPKLAAAYAANWQTLWDQAEAYGRQ